MKLLDRVKHSLGTINYARDPRDCHYDRVCEPLRILSDLGDKQTCCTQFYYLEQKRGSNVVREVAVNNFVSEKSNSGHRRNIFTFNLFNEVSRSGAISFSRVPARSSSRSFAKNCYRRGPPRFKQSCLKACASSRNFLGGQIYKLRLWNNIILINKRRFGS